MKKKLLGLLLALPLGAYAQGHEARIGYCQNAGSWIPMAATISGATIAPTPLGVNIYGQNGGTAYALQCDAGGNLTLSVAPVVNQRTFVSDSGATATASITSPSLTIPSGDVVFVACSGLSGTLTSDVVTSSGAATWNATGFIANASGGSISVYRATNLSGASTFTCTPNASTAHQAMIVMDWVFPPGTTPTFNTVVNGTSNTAFPFVVNTLNTTQRSLEIMCDTASTAANWFTPGVIGGIPASLVGTDSSSIMPTSGLTSCQAVISSTALAGMTAFMEYGVVQGAAATQHASLHLSIYY